MLASLGGCGLSRLSSARSPRHATLVSGLGRPVVGRRSAVAVKALIDPAAADSVREAAAQAINVVASIAEDAGVNPATAIDAVASGAAAAGSARSDSGPFDFLAIAFENILEVLDAGLEKLHVPYSYGFAIILLTLLVKLATFPLTQKQVQSTVAVQALQPRVKELQAKYANNQEELQIQTAALYRDAGVNPLAGCLPTLATIPVFIGLYRALTLAAEDNLLDSDFFWIPSLGGPATVAAQKAGTGLSWLFPFVDGHPPIGWGPAGAYLVLPVLLVVSQYVSQRIISPPSNDPAQQQSQAILKFLPLMIGWFSLNVPAGLTLYWFVNNILSTAQQLYLKKVTKINIPEPAAPPPGVIPSTSTPYISPKEEKVKKVTGKDINARRRRSGDGDVIDVEAETVSTSSAATTKASSNNGQGDKFRARKARDAAARAASVAQPADSSSNSKAQDKEAQPTPVGSASKDSNNSSSSESRQD